MKYLNFYFPPGTRLTLTAPRPVLKMLEMDACDVPNNAIPAAHFNADVFPPEIILCHQSLTWLAQFPNFPQFYTGQVYKTGEPPRAAIKRTTDGEVVMLADSP